MKNNGNKDAIQTATEAAETIAAYGKFIKEYAKNIKLLNQMQGSKGKAQMGMQLFNPDDMEKLAALYESASGGFMNAAKKLADGASEDEVLDDVLTFFTD